MFRVPVSTLDHGEYTFVEHPSAEELGMDASLFGNIEVTLALSVGHRRILADFDVAATGRFTCDRTLEVFDQPLLGQHTVLFLAPDLAPEDGESESLKVLPDDATEIDLTEAVRDTLLLAVPLRKVSPQAESLPIQTTFGVPDDEDSSAANPWAALRALQADSDEQDDRN